jgi:uncharacterized protein (DUF488 family)
LPGAGTKPKSSWEPTDVKSDNREEKTTMLYTIGYQDKRIDKFIAALHEREIKWLLDVRSKPFSRITSYRRDVLKRRLKREGITYSWAGATLGGFCKIKENEIKRLAKWQEGKVAVIMCMEADPWDCHRFQIAERLGRYGVSVVHITKGGELNGNEIEGHICEPGSTPEAF